jgi:hypothetical protein
MRFTHAAFDGLVAANPVGLHDQVGSATGAEAEAEELLLARILGDPPGAAAVGPAIDAAIDAPGAPLPPSRRTRRAGALVAAAVAVALVVVILLPSAAPHRGRASALTAWRVAGQFTPPLWQLQGAAWPGNARDLSCAPSLCVWDGIGGAAEGVIMASHDGGRTWQQVYGPPGSGSLTVGSSTCPAATTCMVITRSSAWPRTAITAHGFGPPTLTVTTDGGGSWATFSLPAAATGLAGIACTTAVDCVVVGGQVSRPFAGVTIDGGRTWTRSELPSGLVPVSVHCVAGSRCVAWGVSTVGVRHAWIAAFSTDGGRGWRLSALPAGTTIAGGVAFACSTGGTCLAVTSDRAAKVTGLLVSDDAGASWATAPSAGLTTAAAPPRLTVLRVACSTATDCWAAGSSATAPGGTAATTYPVIVQTVDGGRHWQPDVLPSTVGSGLVVGQLSCGGRRGCVAGVQAMTGSAIAGERVLSTVVAGSRSPAS